MKKPVFFALIVLVLASLACQLTQQDTKTSTPETPPELPTMEPTEAPSPTPDPVIFRDDFSSTSSGWPSTNDLDGSADYKDGGYEMTVKDVESGYWAGPDLADQSNVTILVDATNIGTSTDNDFGIVCRAQDAANQYLFLISTDGYAVIGKFKDGSFSNISSEEWVQTPAIYQGNVLNTIRADCVDNTFALYVNGELVATATDNDFSSGMVGLTVGSWKDTGVAVLFDNFVVTENNIPVEMMAPSPSNSSGSALYFDDFSDNASGWDNYTSDDGKIITDYYNGGYRIFVDEAKTYTYSFAYQYFEDVIVDVDATKIGGPDDNDFGIMCRVQDADNFYLLKISSDGYAIIAKYSGGDYTGLSSEQMEQSDSINTGSAPNHLRAECVGTELYLYVNDILAAYASDDEFAGGDVGLYAGTYDVPGTDILFDNFLVTAP